MGDLRHEIPDEALEQLPGPETLTGKAARFGLQRFPVWPIIAFLARKKVPSLAENSTANGRNIDEAAVGGRRYCEGPEMRRAGRRVRCAGVNGEASEPL